MKEKPPADSHYTAILENSQVNYKTANSNKLLVKHLSSELNTLKVGESVHFDHFPSGQKASALHAKHIQTRDSKRGDAGTDLTAALARFAFHLLAKGTAKAIKKDKVQITIHTIGVYLRDSYDFTDDGWPSQPLGCWNFENMSFDGTHNLNPFNHVYCVNNADFRDWRTNNQKGGDFRVFSDIEEHTLTPPYVFEMPYTFKEKDAPKKEENNKKMDKDGGEKYTIKSGDTLWDLAGEKYGNSHLWRKIWEANKDIIKDHKNMQLGTVITIPKSKYPPS